MGQSPCAFLQSVSLNHGSRQAQPSPCGGPTKMWEGLPRAAATRLMEQKTQQRLVLPHAVLPSSCTPTIDQLGSRGPWRGRPSSWRGGRGGCRPRICPVPGGLGVEDVVGGRTGVPGASGALHHWLCDRRAPHAVFRTWSGARGLRRVDTGVVEAWRAEQEASVDTRPASRCGEGACV